MKHVSIAVADKKAAADAYKNLSALADAICYARDLVSEPANILYPEEYARRVRELSKHGLEVEVLGETEMKKLGMGSLLGVGQGSVRESQLVVLQWRGGKAGAQPIAFVGKGVCFDTGGISIKKADGMEEMITDMAGSAAVVGAMYALASRKAKVNAVGILGLVENMPDGNAQRPGDVVTSMSGQTIEVINTDAEGRLVLADALWYCQDRFKPKFMVDLATLTGAIVVALGKDLAGVFCNDEPLAANLLAASQASGDPLWRMPLPPQYDKIMDSPVADEKNTGGRPGGSITAAMFLKRFVNNAAWAHIDMAGTAWKPNTSVPDHPQRQRHRLRRAPARPAGRGLRNLSGGGCPRAPARFGSTTWSAPASTRRCRSCWRRRWRAAGKRWCAPPSATGSTTWTVGSGAIATTPSCRTDATTSRWPNASRC